MARKKKNPFISVFLAVTSILIVVTSCISIWFLADTMFLLGTLGEAESSEVLMDLRGQIVSYVVLSALAGASFGALVGAEIAVRFTKTKGEGGD